MAFSVSHNYYRGPYNLLKKLNGFSCEFDDQEVIFDNFDVLEHGYDDDDHEGSGNNSEETSYNYDAEDEFEETQGKSTSNEFDASGFFEGYKNRAKEYDFDEKSVSSVGFCGHDVIVIQDSEEEMIGDCNSDGNQSNDECFGKNVIELDDSDEVQSKTTSYEYSPSGFVVGQRIKAGEFEQVQSRSTSNEYSPSGYVVGRKIRAKDCDVDAKIESSVGVEKREHSDSAADCYEVPSKTTSYKYSPFSWSTSNEYSPSGYIVGRKIRAIDYNVEAHSESSVGVETREQSENVHDLTVYSEFAADFEEVPSKTTSYEYSPSGFVVGRRIKPAKYEELQSRSTSNEYSPSGFFVGRKIRATDYNVDAESEPSIGFGVTREQAKNVNEHAAESNLGADCNVVPSKTTPYEYSPSSWSTSHEYSPSGYIIGRKIKAKDYDVDAKSDSSVEFSGHDHDDEAESSPHYDACEGMEVSDSFYDDRSVEQPEEFHEDSEKLVCNLKRRACGMRNFPSIKRRKISAERDFPIGCGVGNTCSMKEAEEKGAVDVKVGGRQVVSPLMAPQVCPCRDVKGLLKKRCVFKHKFC